MVFIGSIILLFRWDRMPGMVSGALEGVYAAFLWIIALALVFSVLNLVATIMVVVAKRVYCTVRKEFSPKA